MRGRGLELQGWIANRLDPAMTHVDENIYALTERITAPLLGVIGFDAALCAAAAAAGLNLPPLPAPPD